MGTATASREDVHRPSQMDPADYIAVGSIDDHAEEGYSYVDEELVEANGGELDRYADTGHTGATCQHCGHHLRYGEIFLHLPTGELVLVGQTCATKLGLPDRDSLADREEVRRRVMARERGRRLFGDPAARQAIDFAVETILAAREVPGMPGSLDPSDDDHELEYHKQAGIAFEIDLELHYAWVEEIEKARGRQVRAEIHRHKEALGELGLNDFAVDFAASVWRRFERDATLSDKQTAVLLKLKGERAGRQEQTRMRIAEREAAAPVPETDERLRIEGEVVSCKFRDDDFGGKWKVVVKADSGFKVWGSLPSSLDVSEVEVREDQSNARIAFTARVERSNDDETFGFFHRPTKAEVLS